MRKLLVCLLALLLAALPALGEETLETATETHSAGLAVEVTGMALLDEWDGETSQTHVFLAVYATLTNWNAETLTLANALRAELSYEGAYVFEAELAFPVEEMEQLVRVDGALVFRIPTMVAEAAPEGLKLTIYVDGQAIAQKIALEGGYSPTRTGNFEGAGFDSPEDAALAYLEALQNGDVAGMLSTFAIETYVDSLDVQAYLEYTQMFQPNTGLPVAEGGYMRDLAVNVRHGTLAQNLYWQFLYHSWPDGEHWPLSTDYREGVTVVPLNQEENDISNFLDMFAEADFPAVLQGMTFVEFIDPASLRESYLSETNQNHIERQMAWYGCDELTDVVMRLQSGGREYWQILQCVRYGDRWYNFSLSGNLSSLLSLGIYTCSLVPAEYMQLG